MTKAETTFDPLPVNVTPMDAPVLATADVMVRRYAPLPLGLGVALAVAEQFADSVHVAEKFSLCVIRFVATAPRR